VVYRLTAPTVPHVNLVLDIAQGAGLSAAAGLRPFLPTLLAGTLASRNWGLDFEGTSFAFLESTLFLLVLVLAVVAISVAQRRVGTEPMESGPLGAALGGVALGLGALLFAASVADRHDVWWWGLPLGLACAAVAQAAGRDLYTRVRARLDDEAGGALGLYFDGAALLTAGLAVAFPPLGLVAVALFVALLVTGRRRSGEKYAGLRILR
jgi:hypothetical protein